MKNSDICPVVLRASNFRSTKQIPNSEKIKNQYFYRVMIFVDGRATAVSDTFEAVCNKGDVLYLLPDTPYRILNTYGDFEVINIHFDYVHGCDVVDDSVYRTVFQNDFLPQLCRKRYDFSDYNILNKSGIIKKNMDILNFAVKILKEYERKNYLEEKFLSHLMICIIDEICFDEKRISNRNDKYEQIIDYIKNNAELKITANELGEKFHYHQNHINRIIKEETGMNLKTFILKTKIELADKLFENTSMNVTESANYLNFFDASHFIKTYKKFKYKNKSSYSKLHLDI